METSGSFEIFRKSKAKKDKRIQRVRWKQKDRKFEDKHSGRKELRKLVEDEAKKKLSIYVNQHTGELEKDCDLLVNKQIHEELLKIKDNNLKMLYKEIGDGVENNVLKYSLLRVVRDYETIQDNLIKMKERAKQEIGKKSFIIELEIDKMMIKEKNTFFDTIRKFKKDDHEITRGHLHRNVNINIEKKEPIKREPLEIEVEDEDTSDT